MESAIYEGTVRHRRFGSIDHDFEYDLYMVYLDLDEMDGVFDDAPGWSTNGPAPAWFRAEDHGTDSVEKLQKRVRDAVEERTGSRPDGPIRLLTQLRYFGYCFNPVSFFYCFDESGSVQAIVPEVSNTPWRDMHRYVLPLEDSSQSSRGHEFYFDKEFFVSPFMPEDVRYRMVLNTPSDQLRVHMDSFRDGDRFFDATLDLNREPITRENLIWKLLTTPAMTVKVTAAIYYEALKIWFKGASYYRHPPAGQLQTDGDRR
jgi:DUF1365 family protein